MLIILSNKLAESVVDILDRLTVIRYTRYIFLVIVGEIVFGGERIIDGACKAFYSVRRSRAVCLILECLGNSERISRSEFICGILSDQALKTVVDVGNGAGFIIARKTVERRSVPSTVSSLKGKKQPLHQKFIKTYCNMI